MWNVVVLVKCRYSRDECGEGGDFVAGKDSFFAVRQWELGEIRGKGEGGRAYSASNWLGRIKSASQSRFL